MKRGKRENMLRAELVLKHVQRRMIPIQTHEVYKAVLDDFGSISFEAVQKHLRRLSDKGLIKPARNGTRETWGYLSL